MAGVPDTDGDGEGDVLVGGPREIAGGLQSAGRAYLYRADGTLLHTLESPNGEISGQFGTSVAGVPDADGDGRGDLLVGADSEDFFGLNSSGRAYLFSGATGALIRPISPPAGVLQEDAQFGRAVAGVPDLTGDGRGEVLVGSPRTDVDGGQDVGRAVLYDGATGVILDILDSPNPAGLGGGEFGSAVTAVPDVDGDGVADLLIGAQGEFVDNGDPAPAGRAYVFSGATRELIHPLVSPGYPADVSGGTNFFGFSVAGVPDVDGDGRGDLLVGARNEEVEGLAFGRAYVFSGASGNVLYSLAPPAETIGDANGDFGASVGVMPDGEGGWDLLVGATSGGEVLREDGTLGSPGQVYVFDGETGALLAVAESANPSAPGFFGISVAGIPGSAGTFVVGAELEPVGEATTAGRAYIFTSDAESAELAGAEGWRLLAAPVAATVSNLLDGIYTQGADAASTSDGDPSVYRYDESVAGSRDLGFTPLASLGTPGGDGRGFAVYVFTDDDPFTGGVQGGFPKTLDVTGLSFAGESVDFPVSFTETAAVQEDGWNLVGNPYDASLDWDAAGWLKTRVDNVIYVYDAVAGTYRTWNGSAGSLGDGLVAPFQGFWVKASAPDPDLVAPAEARTEAPPPVDAVTASVLAVEVSGTAGGQAVADAAYVTFEDGAAPGLDRLDAYELLPFRATYAALYTEADGTALDVSALPPPDGSVEVPLGLALVADGAAASGTLTLRWPDLARLPASWALTLLDTEAGTETDLRAAPDYTFDVAASAGRVAPARLDGPPVPTPLRASSAEARTSGTRFVLRVAATAVADEGGPEAVFALDAHPNPASGIATLAASLPEAGPARLAVYDALGREVAVLLDADVPAGRHEVVLDAGRLAPGVYVARWQAGGAVVARTLTVVR